MVPLLRRGSGPQLPTAGFPADVPQGGYWAPVMIPVDHGGQGEAQQVPFFVPPGTEGGEILVPVLVPASQLMRQTAAAQRTEPPEPEPSPSCDAEAAEGEEQPEEQPEWEEPGGDDIDAVTSPDGQEASARGSAIGVVANAAAAGPTDTADVVDEADVRGPITTLVLRGIPTQIPRRVLMQELDRAGFKGEYDFIYMPKEPSSRSTNLGHAYVNFQTPEAAARCRSQMTSHCFVKDGIAPAQPVEVAIARIQGLKPNVENYRRLADKRVGGDSRGSRAGTEQLRAQDSVAPRNGVQEACSSSGQGKIVKDPGLVLDTALHVSSVVKPGKGLFFSATSPAGFTVAGRSPAVEDEAVIAEIRHLMEEVQQLGQPQNQEAYKGDGKTGASAASQAPLSCRADKISH